jgi:NADPH-dependent ferric siderophore reductase
MAKEIALKDAVEVDSVDLSNLTRAINPVSEMTTVDASGFNATGSDENLVGNRVSSVTATFFDTKDTGEVHATLWPPHFARDIVELKTRHDQTAAVSAANPELRGNVYVRTYSPTRTRGDVATFDVEFIAADPDGLQWFDAAEIP